MKLVTVATHSERYYPYLELSAKRYGHDLVVLGWGERWQGFTWKYLLLKEYLKTLKPDDIVCFIDAYDVIILEDPKTIEAKFKAAIGDQKDKLFISRDRFETKSAFTQFAINLWYSGLFRKCKGQYICSGTYIGYASTILTLFDNLCTEFDCAPTRNDQVILQDYCIKHEDKFIIDENSDIFIITNSNLVSKINEQEEGITYDGNKLKYGGHYPSILHGPGNARIDDIIVHLGYDPAIYTAPVDDSIKYLYVQLKHFLWLLLKKSFIYIILTVLIVWAFIKHKNIPSTSRNVRSRH